MAEPDPHTCEEKNIYQKVVRTEETAGVAVT